MDGLDPLRPVGGQVLLREEPAVGPREGEQVARDRAAVEGLPALAADRLVRAGQGRVLEDLALARGAAVDQEGAGEARLVLEEPGAAGPVPGDDLRHRLALARGARGGGQELGHRETAEPAVQLEPRVHRSRHRPRPGRVRWDGAVGVRADLVRGQRAGRPARAVEAVEASRLRVPHEREKVAADPAGDRLQEAEGRVHRDRRVHRAAAALEDVHADLGRERVRGGHHAVSRVDHGAGGEGLAFHAVAGQAADGPGEEQERGQDATHVTPRRSPPASRPRSRRPPTRSCRRSRWRGRGSRGGAGGWSRRWSDTRPRI